MHEGTTPLPQAFLDALRVQLGEAELAAYLRAMEQPHTRGLRVNLLRWPDGVLPCAVDGVGEAIPWAAGAYWVTGEARPGLDPLHEGGAYYLQEPSAMTAAALLAPLPGERVLDLCAAPGGKSTQLAAMLGGEGLLICNEIIPSRAQILSRNIERMGVRNAMVTSVAPDALARELPGFFDRILVDAPCSGEGMFRRQEEARAEWTPDAPAMCAQRQMDILHQAVKMLRPGGTMVYSTCTFNPVENEGVLERLLGAYPALRLQPFALPGLDAAPQGYMHLYPHRMRGEGHFISLLSLRADAPQERPSVPEIREDAQARKAWEAFAPEVLSRRARFSCILQTGDALYAVPAGAPQLRGVRVLRAGLCLGHVKGKRIEPDHALAMALRGEEAARTAPFTREQALMYQHGEAISAPEGAVKGYALATLHGCPLGWVKCADGLYKNHYPKGLRR